MAAAAGPVGPAVHVERRAQLHRTYTVPVDLMSFLAHDPTVAAGSNWLLNWNRMNAELRGTVLRDVLRKSGLKEEEEEDGQGDGTTTSSRVNAIGFWTGGDGPSPCEFGAHREADEAFALSCKVAPWIWVFDADDDTALPVLLQLLMRLRRTTYVSANVTHVQLTDALTLAVWRRSENHASVGGTGQLFVDLGRDWYTAGSAAGAMLELLGEKQQAILHVGPEASHRALNAWQHEACRTARGSVARDAERQICDSGALRRAGASDRNAGDWRGRVGLVFPFVRLPVNRIWKAGAIPKRFSTGEDDALDCTVPEWTEVRANDGSPPLLRLCFDFSSEACATTNASWLFDGNVARATVRLHVGYTKRAVSLDFPAQRWQVIPREDWNDPNVVLLGRSESDQLIADTLLILPQHQQQQGEDNGGWMRISPSRVGDVVWIASAQSLDWYRAVLCFALIFVVARRAVSRDDSIASAQILSAFAPQSPSSSSSSSPIGLSLTFASPAHTTFLFVDWALYLLVAIAACWYAIAQGTGGLPPMPTFVSIFIWFVLVAVSVVGGTFGIVYTCANVYKDDGAEWFVDAARHTIFAPAAGERNPRALRSGSLFGNVALRACGFVAGFAGLLFALYWDTMDPFESGCVATILFAAACYLTSHAVFVGTLIATLVAKGRTDASGLFAWCAYLFVVTAIAGIVTGFGFNDVIIPFVLTTNAGAYDTQIIEFLVYTLYALVVLGALLYIFFELPIVRLLATRKSAAKKNL